MKNENVLGKFKRNIANVSIYFFAALLPMALNLLINPLMALNMDPRDYAIVGYYDSFNSLLSPLISFYAFNYYAKRYFELDAANRNNLRATIFKSLIFFSLLLSMLSCLVIFLYMKYFNKESNISFVPYAFLSVFTLPLSGIFTLRLTDYKMQKNSRAFFSLSVGRGILLIALSLLLVVVFKYGALGKMSAMFSATFVVFIYCLYLDYELLKKKMDWKIFKSMLHFVWPLIIGAMLHFFTNGYDRIYLERLGDTTELGFFVVAVQIVGYISVFRTAISNTFQPDIYEAVVARNWKSASNYIVLILLSSLIIVIIFVILAPYVIDILTAGRYTYSAKYARILAFSQLTQAMYFTITEITIVLGFTGLSLVNKIVGVVFTVLLYSLLITKWEFVGAAWGQVLSYLVLMLINIAFLVFWIKRKSINLSIL